MKSLGQYFLVDSNQQRRIVAEVARLEGLGATRHRDMGPGRFWQMLDPAGLVFCVVGIQTGYLLGGTVIIEFVFTWPGVSSLLITAANRREVALQLLRSWRAPCVHPHRCSRVCGQRI